MLQYILDTSTQEYIENPAAYSYKLDLEKLPATFGFFEKSRCFPGTNLRFCRVQ
jgi:hypothetical protein